MVMGKGLKRRVWWIHIILMCKISNKKSFITWTKDKFVKNNLEFCIFCLPEIFNYESIFNPLLLKHMEAKFFRIYSLWKTTENSSSFLIKILYIYNYIFAYICICTYKINIFTNITFWSFFLLLPWEKKQFKSYRLTMAAHRLNWSEFTLFMNLYRSSISYL